MAVGTHADSGNGGFVRKPVSELSGGQKSLLGLALTFALSTYQRCPLYILDEVDAALDEENQAAAAAAIVDAFQGSQVSLSAWRCLACLSLMRTRVFFQPFCTYFNTAWLVGPLRKSPQGVPPQSRLPDPAHAAGRNHQAPALRSPKERLKLALDVRWLSGPELGDFRHGALRSQTNV